MRINLRPEPRPDSRDRRMMENRLCWPSWPYLPLKRRRGNGRTEVAVLYASEPLQIAYGVTVFEVGNDYVKVPVDKIVKVTVDQLMLDGWMVD